MPQQYLCQRFATDRDPRLQDGLHGWQAFRDTAKTMVLVAGVRGSELATWVEEIEIMPGAEISIRVVATESDDQPKL